MLDTIHQFADAKLRERGEHDTVHERHLNYYLVLAESCPDFAGRLIAPWVLRIEADQNNISAAFDWARSRNDGGEAALRLATAMRPFRHVRGRRIEGLAWLDEALAHGDNAPPLVRARALLAKANLLTNLGHEQQAIELVSQTMGVFRAGGASTRTDLAWALDVLANLMALAGDDVRGEAYASEALSLFRAIGSPAGICRALKTLAVIMLHKGDRARSAQLNSEAITIAQQNDDTLVMVSAMWYLHLVSPQRASELAEQEVARQRESGDPERLAAALQYYGYFLLRRGESDRAEDMLRECLALWQQLDQPFTTVTGASHTLLSYGLAAQARGDMDQAIIRFNEAAKLYQEVGFVYGVDAVHLLLAYVALSQGRVAQAATSARNCLPRFHERGSLEESVLAIGLLAEVATAQGQPRRSATLFGATTPYVDRLKVQHRQLLGTSLYLIVGDAFERSVAAARDRLDDPDDAAAWEQGARMTLDEAVAYALEP